MAILTKKIYGYESFDTDYTINYILLNQMKKLI